MSHEPLIRYLEIIDNEGILTHLDFYLYRNNRYDTYIGRAQVVSGGYIISGDHETVYPTPEDAGIALY